MSGTQSMAGQQRRKVIGFDSWTGGVRHFQRLQDPLRRRGFDLTLVHIGSWGSDPGRPSQEQLGDLPVKDISAYPGHSLAGVLDQEQPAAVIFLSTDTFAHRAFNRYCRQRNIPTVNVYHGLVRVQAVDEGSPYRLNPWAQARFVSSRLLKALTLTWPAYSGALWNTRAQPRAWLRFLRDILYGGLGKFSLISAEDAKTDKCCVYVAADVGHAMRKYNFQRKDVTAVGNPDLAQFRLPADAIGAHLVRCSGGSDVMYIDTCLIHTGFVFKSSDEFERHIIETARSLARYGHRLVFKPHPDHRRTGILTRLEGQGVTVCADTDFAARLERCRAAIVEPSSLAIVPALLGMPLFLAQYGPLAGQRFGGVLTSYPRAVELRSLADFDTQLAREQRSCNAQSTRSWIQQNTGPLPAEDMPHRVAELVARMIQDPAASASHDAHSAQLQGENADRAS